MRFVSENQWTHGRYFVQDYRQFSPFWKMAIDTSYRVFIRWRCSLFSQITLSLPTNFARELSVNFKAQFCPTRLASRLWKPIIQCSTEVSFLWFPLWWPESGFFKRAYLAKPRWRRESPPYYNLKVIKRWLTSTTSNNSTNITNDKICLIKKLFG